MALTHKGRVAMGGGLELHHGTFVHTGAAASESLVVTGVVIHASILHNSSSEDVDVAGVNISTSTSGYKNTITLAYNAGAAAGRYMLIVAHG